MRARSPYFFSHSSHFLIRVDDTFTICVLPRRRSLQLFLVAEDKEQREEEEFQDPGGVSFVCHSVVDYMLWLQKYSKNFQKHNFGKVKVGDR